MSTTTPPPTTTTTPPTTTIRGAPRWNNEIWDALKKAANKETERTRIAQKILPIYGPLPDAESVPSDTIEEDDDIGAVYIPEGVTTPLIETTVPFVMGTTQVDQDEPLLTALSATTRTANYSAIAQDFTVFQGAKAAEENLPKFIKVKANGNNGKGLLGEGDRKIKKISVKKTGTSANISKYGEKTVKAVNEGIADLKKAHHYGPYALVLSTDTYSDIHVPLKDTLIMPADRIRPLVEKGLYCAGTLPERRGILLSLGGNTMDLVVGVDTTPEFNTTDNEGRSRFRLVDRFVPRLKRKDAVIRLEFVP